MLGHIMCMGLLSPLPEFIADPGRGWGGCGSAGWTPPPHRPPTPPMALVPVVRQSYIDDDYYWPTRYVTPTVRSRCVATASSFPAGHTHTVRPAAHPLLHTGFMTTTTTTMSQPDGCSPRAVGSPWGGGCQWPCVRQSAPLSMLRPGLFLRPRFGPAAQPPGCSLPPRQVRPKGRWPCISFSWPKHAWAARASPP